MRAIYRGIAACASISMFAGCGPSIYSLRVPLSDSHLTTAGGTVTIDDRRPAEERKVHTGKGTFHCARWYGDETYTPAKVEYLRQLIQARVPAGSALHMRLDRLDTIEYCENTANRGGAAALAGVTGVYIPATDIPGGDSVVIRAVGEANGQPFDVKRGFDYSKLTVPFSQMPAHNPEYVARFESAFGEIADEIASHFFTWP